MNSMSWKTILRAVGLRERGAVRSALGVVLASLGLEHKQRNAAQRNSVAFTIALVALCAKLSKADGVSTALEARAFEQVFHVPPEERANVERLYDLAKRDVAGYDAYADRVAALLAGEPQLKRDVLEALFHIATADGVFHGAEEQYLQDVARRLGFTDAEYRAIRAMFVMDPDDPYRVLGISPDVSDHELKARYRRLVRENHPDTLMGHGVPEEFIDIANRKLAALNAAYDRIAKERAL
jgi:DnaJ like chaperone protein